MKEDKEKVEEVHIARQAAYSTFKAKWDQMSDNSRFLRLLQYSDSQLARIQDQKRVPYVLDYINSSVNTYQGIQRDRRTEIFYYPVESGDEVSCEVLNAVKDSCLSQNNFIYTESDVFADGLIQKVGAVAYEWSSEKDKNGALKIMKLRPRELMWDLNAQEFDKSDCTWMSRFRMYGKEELKNKFPHLSKKIDKMSFFTGGELADLGLRSEYVESIQDSENGWVALIEHFKKVYESRWFIQDKSSGYIFPSYYVDRKSAEERASEKTEQLSQKTGKTPEFRVFLDRTPVYKKILVCHDTLFTSEDGGLEETLDEPFFPIDIYHPYYHDGDWWCPVDVMKDGQRFFNKMFSMADHWIGSMSKGLLLGDSKNPEEEKKVREMFSTTGGFAHVEDVESYKIFESKGPNPQLFTMMELARQNMEDNSGGRNFMGKKETASESGIAVRQRIEQGGLSGFIIFDNLRRWKISVGTKIAWYLTHYMTMPSVVRIEGEELVQATLEAMQQSEASQGWFRKNPLRPGVGFLKVNTEESNTIEGLKVDVNVDEARWSVSKSLSILQELNAAMQSNPMLAQTFPPEVMVRLMPIPFSIKQEALQRIPQLQQMQMALEAAKASKPPALSADLGDLDKLPPEAKMQLLAMFGIKVSPESVMNDPESQKTSLELQAKAEEHKMNLSAKHAEHQMDLQAKASQIGLDQQKQAMNLQAQAYKIQLDAEALKRKTENAETGNVGSR